MTLDTNRFHLFFNQIDNYRERHFLYLTSKGIEATKYPEGQESRARAGQKAKENGDAGGDKGKSADKPDAGAEKAQEAKFEGDSDDEAEIRGMTAKEVEESG